MTDCSNLSPATAPVTCPSPKASAAAPPRSPSALLLPVLAGAQLLIGLDYTIVFVALPDIAALGFTEATLQWVVSAYALTFGGLLLLGGRLVDLVGRRRLLLIGLLLYGVGSALGGLAANEPVLLSGRAAQGLGGAALAPAILALLSRHYPEGPARNRALGVWGAAGSSGMVLGSILGGVLTQGLGWRSVFLVNLPLVALLVLVALRVVPRDPSARFGARLDVPGAVLTTLASAGLVLGFTRAAESGWSDAGTVLALAGGLLAGVLLVGVERRSDDPLIDPGLLGRRFVRVGVGSTFLFMAGFGATPYFLTLYLQQVRGVDPLMTGLAFVLPCLGVLAGTALGARLASRRGLRPAMIAGQVLGLVGCGAFALVADADTPWWALAVSAVVFSLGQGVVFTTMFAAATTGVPDERQGSVGGLATTTQQLGGAIGLALLITAVAVTGSTSASAITPAMAGITAVIGLGLLLALRLPGPGPAAGVDGLSPARTACRR